MRAAAARRRTTACVQTRLGFSMHGLITASRAPPPVATKSRGVHHVGHRLRSPGNSCRSTRDERPFTSRTNRWMPNWGSAEINPCTGSGMTSMARVSARLSAATSRIMVFRRSSTALIRTRRRYFGHQTTGYGQEYPSLRLDLNFRTTRR